MSRGDREKLTDVLNRTDRPFAPTVSTFEQAYPTIAKLSVEITESKLGTEPQTWTLTESTFRHAINCSNSVCYRGGVELGWIIHDMVRDRKTDSEQTKRCQGYEGSPKGKKRYCSCMHSFRIKAHVEYKDGVPNKRAAT